MTLGIIGALGAAEHFVKAIAEGADRVAVANGAMQAADCIAAGMCVSNHSSVDVTIQKLLLCVDFGSAGWRPKTRSLL